MFLEVWKKTLSRNACYAEIQAGAEAYHHWLRDFFGHQPRHRHIDHSADRKGQRPSGCGQRVGAAVFLFTFILASVAEEFLFRGFLQNYLKPFSDKGFKLFRRRISLPVLVSAVAFSLAHLILLVSGVEALFMIRMLVFTFALGLIAGYYQEKYDNHAFAIIVHMAGNLMGLVSILMM